MPDDLPPKKVVKRVVKKQAPPTPTVRYGRPVEASEPAPAEPSPPKVATRKPRKRPVAKVEAPPVEVESDPAEVLDTTSVATTVLEPQPETEPDEDRPKVARRSVDVGAAVRRAREGAGSVGSGVGRAAGRTGRVVASGLATVRRWRPPTLEPVRASLLTGALVGLLAVLLGRGALELFSVVRGVASGGGTWGSLTFVVIGFVAFAAGELLLGAFGVAQARLISFLGIVVAVIAILGLFLEQADSILAIGLVPALGAVAFALARWLVVVAEQGADAS